MSYRAQHKPVQRWLHCILKHLTITLLGAQLVKKSMNNMKNRVSDGHALINSLKYFSKKLAYAFHLPPVTQKQWEGGETRGS